MKHWQLVSSLLFFSPLLDSPTAANVLQHVRNEFDRLRLFSSCNDNCAVMKKAFVGLPELTDIEDANQEEPEEDGFLTTSQTEIEGLSEEDFSVVSWHGCVAHLLQLVVQVGLKAGAVYIRYSNTISKCKKIAGLGKWSVQFSSKLSKRIMQATGVRWNSFFAMLTSIFDQHEKISRALVECRKEDLKLNDNEIHLVRNFTKLLKYFQEATDILQLMPSTRLFLCAKCFQKLLPLFNLPKMRVATTLEKQA